MNEMDFENQMNPDHGNQRPRRSRGYSEVPLPPIDDEDELAYIYRAARSTGYSEVPLPPTEDKSMNEAATDNKDDATSSGAEPPRTEGSGSPETKGSQNPQKAQKAASRTSATRTTKSTSTSKKSSNRTSAQSSHHTSHSQQALAQKDDDSGIVWVILYYAYLLIGFPVFLITNQICNIIANALDIGAKGSQFGNIIDWSYERTIMGFALWRKIVFIVGAIAAVVVIIYMIFK